MSAIEVLRYPPITRCMIRVSGMEGQNQLEIELYYATVASCRIKSWENTVQSYAA